MKCERYSIITASLVEFAAIAMSGAKLQSYYAYIDY